MKKLGIFYFIFLIMNPSVCNQNEVKITSAKIDKHLIPILYDLVQEDFQNAENAVLNLKRHWDLFKGSIDNIEEDYSDNFGRIPDYIDDRLGHLLVTINNEDKASSIYIFEEIQTALSDWRVAHNMEYYVDDLFKFKYDVDIFTCIAEDELLDLCDWEELEWQYENIQASFYFLNTHDDDLDYFEIDKTVFQNKISNINGSIMELNKAMEKAEREEVERIAHILQSNVLDVVFVFGDCGESYVSL